MKTPERCAVVFDWNGTLLADTALCLHATNKSLALFGAAPASLEAYRREHRLPLDSMYEALGCSPVELKARRQELMATWSAVYDGSVRSLRLRRGAKTVLGHVRACGHKLAILSNHVVEEIEARTTQHGIRPHFDAILANAPDELSAIMEKRSKGKRLQGFIEAHDIRNALVVGDTPEEIEIAHAYGYSGVALSDGVCSLSRLRAAKPDFMIRSLAEMPDIIARVFG